MLKYGQNRFKKLSVIAAYIFLFILVFQRNNIKS